VPEPQQQDRGVGDVVAEIAAWLVGRGLEGAPGEVLLEGYCARLVSAGIPLLRVHVAQRALHPVFGGLGFDWHRSGDVTRLDYARASMPTESWVRSPFYYMLKEGVTELRERLVDSGAPLRFPVLDEQRANGATDYFARSMPFDKSTGDHRYDPNDPPEGMVISWVSDAPDGFSDDDIGVLRGLLPPLGLGLKSASNRQMAQDLMATYLGADAGARVLSGEIRRGSLETIHAVILCFDLQGFTGLAETTPGPSVIAMLNDYFGTIVAVIEAHGGNVLKFMGDGLLAIFSFADQENASRSAVAAATELRDCMAHLNTSREGEGLPHTEFSLALHAGNVLYGNIGAETRLDFTVIGPAVNATARILDLCRPLERDVIMSSDVARSVMAQRDDVVSLGPYVLRGIPGSRELFTLTSPLNR
jgi:adenylate cyclase